MKIAALFPGYGSQYVGMGKELYDESRVMQEYFEEASNCLNINFVKLCFASSDAEISRIDNALLANLLVSSALFALLKEQGFKPDVVIGHNAGEYAAIYSAGGISFPDILYMIQKYGTFYLDVLQTLPIRIIRVTGLEIDDIKKGVSKYIDSHQPVYISSYESKTEHIIAGYEASIEALRDQYMSLGAKKAIGLEVIDGLHSVLMKPVYDNLHVYSEKVDFKGLSIPLLTMTHVKPISSKTDVKTEMLEQVVLPVQWVRTVQALDAYDMIIEIGPGTALSDKLKKIYPNKTIAAVNKSSDVEMLKTLIAGSQSHQDNVQSSSE